MHTSEFQENRYSIFEKAFIRLHHAWINDFFFSIIFLSIFLGSEQDCLSVSYDYIDYLIYNATYIGNVCLKLTCNKQITSHIKVEIC